MRWMKVLAVSAALSLLVSCFLPWVTIPVKNVDITGVQTEGTAFGKPGYMHILMVVIYIPLVLLNKNWSKRAAFFLCALNLGWAFRNFIIISACYMGDCPVKHTAIYLLPILSIAMTVLVLFVPGTRGKENGAVV